MAALVALAYERRTKVPQLIFLSGGGGGTIGAFASPSMPFYRKVTPAHVEHEGRGVPFDPANRPPGGDLERRRVHHLERVRILVQLAEPLLRKRHRENL